MVAAILTIPKYSDILTKHRSQLILVAIGLGVVGKLIPNGFGMIDPIGQTLGYTLLAVIFSLAITAAVVGERTPTGIGGDLLKSKALRMLGKYSFAMYLFHAPLNTYVGLVMLDRMGWREHPSTLQGLIYVALVGICSLILAILSYELLERHFLRMKRFFAH
jgi:peptidoglycan/LPS O-acetylase OafA/YrhL